MAYAALISVTQVVLEEVLRHHDQNYNLHGKQQIKIFHEQLIFLQIFLEDFPDKANHLEQRIKNAANEAEDIAEYFIYNISKSTAAYTNGKFATHLDFKRLNQELRKVAEEIDSIVKEVMKNNNSHTEKEIQFCDDSYTHSLSRIELTSKDDLMAIRARLCAESSQLQVIPIFGMGGIGKTTLARNAYKDPSIMQHFRIRAWVNLSRNYSAREIFLSLLLSMKAFEETLCTKSNEEIAEQVYTMLKGRRYLIVMDNMWSTKAWDDVKMKLPDDNNGSRIILTTRLLDVTTHADSCSLVHEMHLMNVNESWDLIQSKIFKQESCPHELENIGKTIARSCLGLPLAIVLIAGLLSVVSLTQVSWKKIAEKVKLAFFSTQDEHFSRILSLNYTEDYYFAPILSLSYTLLPHHLRPCFLYMGSFPEDQEICVSRLIKLWVAEGFLKPSESKSFEDVSEEYLEDLAKRNLIFVQERSSKGKIKTFNIHDLLRDICIRKGQEEKFFLLPDLERNFDKILLDNINDQRRISFCSFTEELSTNICGSSIHTILYFQFDPRSFYSIQGLKLLRVLDALYVIFLEFPVVVLELTLLRYLALTFNCHESYTLPEKLQDLQKLQTLALNPIITSEGVVVNLPSAIWRMPQLRHIISLLGLLPAIPTITSFSLQNLQTLSTLRNFNLAKSFLDMVPNLKKLGISYFDIQWSNFPLENLVHLHQLERLKFSVNNWFAGFQEWKFAFPMSLKKLTLSGRVICWQDLGIVSSLPNLEVLKLINREYYSPTTWKTKDGDFPCLKFLLVKKTDLKHWITESSHFPRLERLLLYECEKLSEIPKVIGDIPTLQLIEVDGYSSSVAASAKRIRQEQQSFGNDGFKVRVIYGPWKWFNNGYEEEWY